MFENIAAAHRWAIDKGAARIKVTSAKSQSQVYYDLVRKEVEEYAVLPFLAAWKIKKPWVVWKPMASVSPHDKDIRVLRQPRVNILS